MDLTAFVPIIVALIAGGAVAFYTARPRKNTLIAEAADKAVDVVTKAIDRQEVQLQHQAESLRAQEEELRKARDRIVALEIQLRNTIELTAQAEQRIAALHKEVERLGGDIEGINGKPGPPGPPGPQGPRGDVGPHG